MGSLSVQAPPRRASLTDKERVARRLREACVDELLSPDTFARRLDLAYSARTRDELDRLVHDIAPPGWPTRAVLAAVRSLSRWTWQVGAAWREPRTARLALPTAVGERTIGRSHTCDYVLADPGVSRVHAVIEREERTWRVRDAGSINGTWLNGWRLTAATELRPGDELQVGGSRFIVEARP